MDSIKTEQSEESIKDEKRIIESNDKVTCEGIKSTAVVKKCIGAADIPARFLQLSCNTNLNDPPSNWLRMRAIQRDHKYKQGRETRHREEHEPTPWVFPKQNSTLFSSFVIANNFPDYVGEVDVVSDAENIKKLLKIPFSNSHISMMVHRIGKTLLLDEFDIHSQLLRASKKEWQWLKKFYYDHLNELQENEKKCLRKNKSRGYLQYKNMLSKFLYHSVIEEEKPKKEDYSSADVDFEESSHCSTNSPTRMPSLASITFQGGSTVEQLVPRSTEEVDPGNERHEFLRNVLWTFEDIRMLIGSDLPIFGGGTHPVVSLRLRDMKNPINVLTGLDYWLDNLMCNVPEVVMCYHLDGIVKKYELLKTEEIPQMTGSLFNPKLVKDIAQNLLSFLKSKATKSGHTYWLFKGKNDDVVKLYDLTTLLDQEEEGSQPGNETEQKPEEKRKNPFTLPVAMLLYRVAINMKESKQGKPGTIYKLLNNCLLLIDKITHPQVAASAHYLLAELFLPHEMDPSIVHQSINFPLSEESDDTWQSSSDESLEEKPMKTEEDGKFSVDVKSLCRVPVGCLGKEGLSDAEKAMPPFGQNWLERCLRGLREVVEGLRCIALKLQSVSKTTETSNSNLSSEMNQNSPESTERPVDEYSQFARPSQSIPLPFTPLKGKEEKAVAKSPKQNLEKNYCRAMLFHKAVQIYGALGEIAFAKQEFGKALQCVQLGLLCHVHADHTGVNYYVSHLLGLAGDIHVHVFKSNAGHKDSLDQTVIESHQEEFEDFSLLDSELKQFLQSGLESEYNWCCWFPKTMEEALNISIKCYETAIQLYVKEIKPVGTRKEAYLSLTRRLANVCNELGIHRMNQGIEIWNATAILNERVEKLWKNSEKHLTSALKSFEETNDVLNSALLNSNLGRLMRLCASAYHTSETTATKKKSSANQEKRYYQKAVQYYNRAIDILCENKNENAQLWETIHWDLCTTYFVFATQLQDFPPANISQEEVEQEIVTSMKKALELCERNWSPSIQVMYQYRAAVIHHRLGSLNHNAMRNTIVNDQRRKQLKQMAEEHYSNAANLYETVNNNVEFLSVLLKWMALRESNLETQTGAKSKIRTINQVLQVAVKSKNLLRQVENKDTVAKEKNLLVATAEEDEEEKMETLLNLLCQRLKVLSKDFRKLQKSGKSSAKQFEKVLSILDKKENVIENISSALDIIEKCIEI